MPLPSTPRPLAVAPLRVAIVDDERLARTRLRQLLRDDPGVRVTGAHADGRDFLDALGRARAAGDDVDVVLLDVRMPEADGLAIAAALAPGAAPSPAAPRGPLVVFVTAYDEHAVRAFDVEALDYVVKPVAPERLQAALQRARARLDMRGDRGAGEAPAPVATWRRGAPPAPPAPIDDRLLVRAGGTDTFVRIADISVIEALGNYARLHALGRRYLIRERMGALEARLEPHHFARIHRSAIVNLDHVREIVPRRTGDHVLVLADGRRYKFTRWYRARFKARLRQAPRSAGATRGRRSRTPADPHAPA